MVGSIQSYYGILGIVNRADEDDKSLFRVKGAFLKLEGDCISDCNHYPSLLLSAARIEDVRKRFVMAVRDSCLSEVRFLDA